jgi:hypothetical protein
MHTESAKIDEGQKQQHKDSNNVSAIRDDELCSSKMAQISSYRAKE